MMEFDAEYAKIFGKATGEAVSNGLLKASHVVKPTVRLDFLGDSQFLNPDTTHVIGYGPDAILSVPENLITTTGSIDEKSMLAIPIALPF
jgi:hypothetical protein